MYRPLALGGAGLVSAEQLRLMGTVVAATSIDAVLLVPSRWALGFVKTIDNRYLPPADQEGMFLSEEAFGHPGMGGSLGFADPKARLSFGYTMNRQGTGLGVNERGQSLVDAVYRVLGYDRVGDGGTWYAP
jgi:CubicO group peptidase (beta-lactamase class C family)